MITMHKLEPLVLLIAFAMPAFSQIGGGSLSCNANAAVPARVRAEGRSELMGDIVMDCWGGVAGNTGTLNFTIYLNTQFANRVPNPATGLSDALLLIDEAPVGVLNSNLFQGVVIGNQVQFLGIPFTAPGASSYRVLRFMNLRADVAPIVSQVQAFISASGSFSLPINNPTQVVAFSEPGLTTAIRTSSDAAATAFSYQQCAGQNAALLSNPAAPASVNFNMKFSERFSNAFRKSIEGIQQNVPGTIYNTETGYSTTAYPALGMVDSGTRLVARFSGIPAGVSLYVTTRPSPAGTTAGMLNNVALTSADANGAGPYSAISPTGSVIINSSTVGIAQIPLTNGSGTATWEILGADPMVMETVSFGVVVAYSSAGSMAAPQLRMSLGPVVGYSFPTASSPLPRFRDDVAPVVPFTVQACTPCGSLISPYTILDAFSGASQANAVTVTANPGCAWTASSDSGWITVTQGTGAGSGTVLYNLAPNSGSPRTGHLAIAGQTFTITQGVPSLSISNGSSLLPNSVAPGGVIDIMSSKAFGPPHTVVASPAGGQISTVLGQTRVLFDGVPAPVLAVGPNQVSVAVPYGVNSTTLVELEYDGTKLDYAQIPVLPAVPVIGGVSNGAGPLSSAVIAPSGSVVSVFVNGVGQTTPAGIDGKVFSVTSQRPVPVQSVTASLGGTLAQVVSANAAGYENASWPLGFTEVRVLIPASTPAGGRSLGISVGGASAQGDLLVIVDTTPCSFSLLQTSRTAPAAGGSDGVQLTTASGCYWTAVSNAGWLTVTSAASGTGSTTVTFSAAPNTGAGQRTGTISIGGQTLTVTQAGTASAVCLNAPSTVWFDSVNSISAANGASDRLLVGRMPADKYSLLSNVPLPANLNQKFCGTIPIAPGYTAEAYVPTPAERAGDFAPFSGLLLDPLSANQPFPGGIIPAARIPATMAWRVASATPCTVSVTLAAEANLVASTGASRQLTIIANNTTCGWAATTSANWISFPNGSTGIGSGSLTVTVANNPTSLVRSAQITVAGMSMTISQTKSSATFKIGIVRNGTWYLDSNGTRSFNNGVDSTFNWWAGAGTIPVTGDWNGSGTTKAGFFKDGLWYLDYDGNGIFNATDKVYGFGWSQPGIVPLVGDWNGDGRSKVAVFYNGFWYLDHNGNGTWDGSATDRVYGWGWQGVTPLIGDWNGDGRTKIGFFINGFWYLDYNGNGIWEPALDRVYGWGWNGVTPVVGDWNGDGRKKIGFFVNGFWYLDYNGDGVWDNGVADKLYGFGWNGVTPLVGDWSADGRDRIGIFINGLWYLDFNGTGVGAAASVGGLGQGGDMPITGRW